MSRSSDPGHGFAPAELTRYSRHLVLPEVGLEGQARLREASVLVVGAGGLGSPLALYLAAAGVGRLGLVDFDAVDLSNLQRQILYGEEDVGRSKVSAAGRRLAGTNPHVALELHETRLDAENALELLRPYEVVVDGTDNFSTRFLVSDACVLLGKPNVYGSVYRFEGQASVFHAGKGPCYRCLFPAPPAPGSVPSCSEGGVLGVLPGIIGAVQATEAIKLILGRGESLLGRLLLFDAMEMRFRELALRRDPDCPVCGEGATLRELHEIPAVCEPSAAAAAEWQIDVQQLSRLRSTGRDVELIDVRTPGEWALCRIDGARLIPLPDLERRIHELDPGADTVIYCHVGIRSAYAVEMLRRHGFRSVRNLTGGIEAWAVSVDPAVPRY